MHFHTSFTLLVSLLSSIITHAAITPRTSTPPSVRDVWRFPNVTWVENIAVRSSGQLLVTLSPVLYQVDPHAAAGQQPQLIQRFPNVTSLMGIVEVGKDVFAVIAGNFSLKTAVSTPGSYSVWKVDMRPLTSSSPANITKIADIPEGVFLNGMTALDEDGNVLIADSGKGVVWRLDTNSGDYKIAIDDPLMKPAAGARAAIGINGIKIRNSTLYFTNTFRFTFNRVPINSNGTAAGAAEVVVQNGMCDDFTFDRAGNAWVALEADNTLQKITPEGAMTAVVGNKYSTELVGPTAMQFGRTPQDESILYITTNGGLAAPVNGTYIEGGKVAAVDLSGLV